MIEYVLALSAILYLALQIEDRLKIPSPLSLIILSFAAHHLLPDFSFAGDAEHFAAIVLLLLPILLISDSLELSTADLKEHAWSLFYLAVVAIALSILVAILFRHVVFSQYDLSIPAIIVLFAMVLATDPVSVVSIFSKFELPHRLKILAEGESLFNDATALIVFVFIGLHGLGGGEISFGYVTEISLIVTLGSALLGLIAGYLGLIAMKTTTNRIAEMMVLILTGYGAFFIAEHFYALLNFLGGHSHLHLSGILACIVATVTVHQWMTHAIDEDTAALTKEENSLKAAGLEERKAEAGWSALISGAVLRIRMSIEEKQRHLRTKEDIQLLALVANTILFVTMAEIVNFENLWQYKEEIVVMFIATTILRAAMMAKFAVIANQTDKMTNINYRWWSVLTFAGIKGGLSVVMLSMIPKDFPHLAMFEAVVIGVIILSTFVYSLLLLIVIAKNAEEFHKEAEQENH